MKADEIDPYDFIATLECCEGNETVGTAWLEHHLCTAQTTIGELWKWRDKTARGNGKLIIAKAS